MSILNSFKNITLNLTKYGGVRVLGDIIPTVQT